MPLDCEVYLLLIQNEAFGFRSKFAPGSACCFVTAAVAVAHDFFVSCDRSVEEILVLQNMPREHVGAELSRELGRAFLFLADEWPATDAITEQGFAELCCYLWVRAELQALDESRAECMKRLSELRQARKECEAERACILSDVMRAQRERVQANEAEAFARKQLSEAREAKLFGWPGAERKMEAARLAAAEAEKVLADALEAESQVMGSRLPHVEEELARFSSQEEALQRQGERDEQLTAAYEVYLLTMENNPHPIMGAGLRAALAGYDSVGGDMKLFVEALLSTGRFAEPRRKTADELRAEAEEAERARRAYQESEDAERNRISQERISALRTRLAEAPCGAPGPPPALLVGTMKSAPTSETELNVDCDDVDDAIIDELQDRFHCNEPGSMDAAALVEYFSHKIRGEHSQPYCCELGEGHLRTVHTLRASGDLEGALQFCDKAETAFAHAGSEGEKKMFTVTSLKNSIQREQSQLQTAISFQKKAENAVQGGILFDGFRKFYKEAMNLYKGCGIAASKDDRLPALERLYSAVLVQEEYFRTMSQALEAAKASLVDSEWDEACQRVAEAVSMIDGAGAAGYELGAKATQLQKEIKTSLLQKAVEMELRARAALDSKVHVDHNSQEGDRKLMAFRNLIDSENLNAAELAVQQMKRMFLLMAVSSCEVDISAAEDKLFAAQENQARKHNLSAHSLSCEIQGSQEQRRIFEVINECEFCIWPDDEDDLAMHIQHAKDALGHLKRARALFLEAGNSESISKVDALQCVELDLALRTGANDISRNLLEFVEPVGKKGCDERMPFICVAAALNNVVGLQMLLAKGADINAQDQYGNTPLHLAVIFDASSALKAICTCKTLNPNLKNNAGRTPLICAVSVPKRESISPKLIIWHLIDSKPLMKFKSGTGTKSLDSVQNSSIKSIIATLLELPKVDPNCTSDFDGKTALIVACELDMLEAIDSLLKDSRIQPNIPDLRGRTALISAICKNKPVSLLLRCQKVDPNAADPVTGRSPLYYAITRWNIEALSQIAEHECIQSVGMDLQGWTPLHSLEFEYDSQASSAISASKVLAGELGCATDARRMPICRWWVTCAARAAFINSGSARWSSSETFLHILSALTDARYWGVLHGFLTHMWVLVSAIMHLGIDTVYFAVKASVDTAHTYSGVSKVTLSDLDLIVKILEMCCNAQMNCEFKSLPDEVRVFISALKQHGQVFSQRIKSFTLDQALQVQNESVIDLLSEKFSGSVRKFMWLKQIKKFGFHSILSRPHLVTATLNKIQRSIGQCVQSYGLQKCIQTLHPIDMIKEDVQSIFGMPKSNQVVIERLSAFLELVPHTSTNLKIIFASEWSISNLNRNLIFVCSNLRSSFEMHGCFNVVVRAVRFFVYSGTTHILLSVTCHQANSGLQSVDPGITRLVLNGFEAHCLSRQGCSEGCNDSDAPARWKVVSAGEAEPSIFLLLQLVIPCSIFNTFKTRQQYESQLLNEILTPFSKADTEVRIERMSDTFSSVILEFLPKFGARNHADVQKIKRLVKQLNTKGTSAWKGEITSHVVSATHKQDVVPPGFPEEWNEARVIIFGLSAAIDDEIHYLEQFVLPSLQTFCVKYQCLIKWDFVTCSTEPRIILQRLKDIDQTQDRGSVLPINIVVALDADPPSMFEDMDSSVIQDIVARFPWANCIQNVGSETDSSHSTPNSTRDILAKAFLSHPRVKSLLFKRKICFDDENFSEHVPGIVQQIVKGDKQSLDPQSIEPQFDSKSFNIDLQVEYVASFISFNLDQAGIKSMVNDLCNKIKLCEQAIVHENQGWKKLTTSSNGFLIQARVSQLQQQIVSFKEEIQSLYDIACVLLDAESLEVLTSKNVFQTETENHEKCQTRSEIKDKDDSIPMTDGSVLVLRRGIRYDVRWAMFQIAISMSSVFRKLPQVPVSRSVSDRHFQIRDYQYFLMREYSTRSAWVEGEPRSLLIQGMTKIFESDGETSPVVYMLQGPNYSGRTTILSKVADDGICRVKESGFPKTAVIFYFRLNEPFNDLMQYYTKEIAFQVRGGIEWSSAINTSTQSSAGFRTELQYALSLNYHLILIADNLESSDQIRLCKEVLDCLKSTTCGGTVKLIFSTENSKLFKYNALQAGLVGDQKDLFKVFMMKGLTKNEQLSLWSHFVRRCDTEQLHNSEYVLKCSKQDLESPLYLLFLALLPILSQTLSSDNIVKQVDALSGKVAQLWKHDILPRIAFSTGMGIDAAELAINILLSHCMGLRKDVFIPMAVHIAGEAPGAVRNEHKYELLTILMKSFIRPSLLPQHSVAVEHIHLHMSSTHDSELKRMCSLHISTSGNSTDSNQEKYTDLYQNGFNSLKEKIVFVRNHHQDLFVRCVLQPLVEIRNQFPLPKLESKVIKYCRTKVTKQIFEMDSQARDVVSMPLGMEMWLTVNRIVSSWCSNLKNYLDSCHTSVSSLDDDIDGLYSASLIRLQQVCACIFLCVLR